MKTYLLSTRVLEGNCVAPVLIEPPPNSGNWIPPTRVNLASDVQKEREFTDAVINAIGEISVAECQAAIQKWRAEH